MSISPKELKDKMLEIYNSGGDPEMDHSFADELLCEALIELGYGEAVDIFNKINKYYS